jgi:hypothetical protein
MALVTPQEFLDTALKLRGYSTESHTTINSGYSNMPTKLQVASYDVHILKMIIRDKDEHRVREMLTCGISPNQTPATSTANRCYIKSASPDKTNSFESS